VLAYGIGCFICCTLEVLIVGAFLLLSSLAAKADRLQTNAVVTRVVSCPQFELVLDNVLEQHTVAEVFERRYFLAEVLKEAP
jgi:hypothetical protein